MQPVTQALEEMKGLYQRVVGSPAPDFGPQAYAPFPAGVDPLKHALLEVERLTDLSERATLAPRPCDWVPAADTFVTKDLFVVQLAVPGVLRDDLQVFITGGECVVRGECKPPQDLGEFRPLALERPWGSFERRFVMPVGSRVDDIKARCVDGVLELRVPLGGAEAPSEQRIDIL